MKNLVFLLAALCLSLMGSLRAQVAVNTTGNPADASAMLDINAHNKGILIPRLSSLERLGIANPATGLLVYDTTTATFQYFDGTQWKDVGSGGSALGECIRDADQDTYVCVDTAGTDLDEVLISIDDEIHWKFIDRRLETTRESIHLGRGSGAADTNYSSFANVAIGDSSMAEATHGQLNVAIGTNAMIRADSVNDNTAVGSNALFFTASDNNTAVGSGALFRTDTGSDNVAVGVAAMLQNESGYNNIAIGNGALQEAPDASESVAIGHQAMVEAKGRTGTIAIGARALQNNGQEDFQVNDATGNTAIGYEAMQANTSGRYNVALGYQALYSNIGTVDTLECPSGVTFDNTCSRGDQNIAIGHKAGFKNRTGAANVFIGKSAGGNNVSGSTNVFIGNQTGSLNTTGGANVFLGGGAGGLNETGSWNIALGRNSMQDNKTGSRNIVLGGGALRRDSMPMGIVAIGDSALAYNMSRPNQEIFTGTANTAVGHRSLFQNVGGSDNTALGYEAGSFSNSTGNVYLGHLAGNQNVGNGSNTYVGNRAGSTNIDGEQNVFVGGFAGTANGGSENVYLGEGAGENAITNGGVFLGHDAGKNVDVDNRLYIENSDRPDALIYGEFDNRKVEINGGLKVNKVPNAPNCGFILPRYTGEEVAELIPNPEPGAMIFVTEASGNFEEPGFYGYNGEEWRRLDNTNF